MSPIQRRAGSLVGQMSEQHGVGIQQRCRHTHFVTDTAQGAVFLAAELGYPGVSCRNLYFYEPRTERHRRTD